MEIPATIPADTTTDRRGFCDHVISSVLQVLLFLATAQRPIVNAPSILSVDLGLFAPIIEDSDRLKKGSDAWLDTIIENPESLKSLTSDGKWTYSDALSEKLVAKTFSVGVPYFISRNWATGHRFFTAIEIDDYIRNKHPLVSFGSNSSESRVVYGWVKTAWKLFLSENWANKDMSDLLDTQLPIFTNETQRSKWMTWVEKYRSENPIVSPKMTRGLCPIPLIVQSWRASSALPFTVLSGVYQIVTKFPEFHRMSSDDQTAEINKLSGSMPIPPPASISKRIVSDDAILDFIEGYDTWLAERKE